MFDIYKADGIFPDILIEQEDLDQIINEETSQRYISQSTIENEDLLLLKCETFE